MRCYATGKVIYSRKLARAVVKRHTHRPCLRCAGRVFEAYPCPFEQHFHCGHWMVGLMEVDG